MTDSLKQSQRAGDHSTNVQAQQVEIHHHHHYQGLTPAEAQQVLAEAQRTLMGLFEENFLRLQASARRIAEERAREITETFLAELMERNPAGLECAQDPDMQAVLFTAQRDYARSGSEDLEQVLVNLLVQRTSAASNDLLRIVLNEAVAVAPKLTEDQLDTLSLILLFAHDVPFATDLKTWDDVKSCLSTRVAPFIHPSLSSFALFSHLKYTGTITIDGSGLTFLPRLAQAFASVEHLKHELDAFQQSDALFDILRAVEPQLDILNNIYHDGDSLLDIAQLTPVGIALANANLRRKTGLEFTLDRWVT